MGIKGKGKVLRPCKTCGTLVNFIPWPEERYRGNIWHWANADGTHHVCWEAEQNHLKDIMREGQA